jgi:hypothetical protein
LQHDSHFLGDGSQPMIEEFEIDRIEVTHYASPRLGRRSG